MLVLPKPAGWDQEEWEKAEYEAMKGVVDLYGKTWHFWQVDRGDELPLGRSSLCMTSHFWFVIADAFLLSC
jgi:hypothetical protein